jgi:hypothetical protein
MALYPETQQPQGEGILARLGRFMTPKSPQEAGQMMVNPVGAVLPGMLSESRLVPSLLKILREKGLDPAKAEGVLMDAVTAGRIDPNQFKMVFEALKKIGGGGQQMAAREFAAGTKAMPPVVSTNVSAPQAGVPAVSEMVRRLRQKFQGGQ